ncbi:hypothetical protein HK405_007657 [Cladochytrium tenue]|nr:hypothetical protein HK405_007657 [Cladochytrium tenue]
MPSMAGEVEADKAVFITSEGKKQFVPLENSPEALTALARGLGLSDEIGFYDVYGLDGEALQASAVPRPVYALIFIAPPHAVAAVRAIEGTRVVARDGLTYKGGRADDPVLWFHQVVNNACGLFAVLHSVANSAARAYVRGGSLLARVLAEAAPLGAVERAELINNSDELAVVHTRAARGGASRVPPASEHAELHFIAFTRGEDGRLWDLEGNTDGPIECGWLKDDDDALSDRALAMGVGRFLERAGGNVNFSLVALAKNAN